MSDVDPRVRVFDANFAAPGHRAGSDGPPGSGRLAAILAQAEVLLVGYPVPEHLAAMSPASWPAADNLRRYLDGQPLLNEVDRARGY